MQPQPRMHALKWRAHTRGRQKEAPARGAADHTQGSCRARQARTAEPARVAAIRVAVGLGVGPQFFLRGGNKSSLCPSMTKEVMADYTSLSILVSRQYESLPKP